MPAKLYRCSVAFDLYVVAESENEARSAAEHSARDELSYRSVFDTIGGCHEVKGVQFIEPEWKKSLPYLGDSVVDENMTCEQYMERIVAERRPADLPGQGKLFDAAETPGTPEAR